MKEIKCLAGLIREELEDAEKYAKKYLMYRESDASLASLFKRIANEELTHSALLHDQAVRIIKSFSEQGGEVPASMTAVWEWEHENMIHCRQRVQLMLESM